MTPQKKKSYRNELSKDEKTWRQKGFVTTWMDIDCFKGWLSIVPSDKSKAFCKACNKELNAGKSDLLKHAKTELHIRNVNKKKNMQSLSSFGFSSSIKQETIDMDEWIYVMLFFRLKKILVSIPWNL